MRRIWGVIGLSKITLWIWIMRSYCCRDYLMMTLVYCPCDIAHWIHSPLELFPPSLWGGFSTNPTPIYRGFTAYQKAEVILGSLPSVMTQAHCPRAIFRFDSWDFNTIVSYDFLMWNLCSTAYLVLYSFSYPLSEANVCQARYPSTGPAFHYLWVSFVQASIVGFGDIFKHFYWGFTFFNLITIWTTQLVYGGIFKNPPKSKP